jgi:tol-pal system protein YbgF
MAAGKHIIGGVLLALTLLAAAVPTGAQELSLNALIERLDRLERGLGGVQRLLAREGVPDSAYEPVAPQPQNDSGAARQEIRIGELQEQIRLLTGQVEQARYEIRRLSDQVALANTDYEERITALEQKLAGAAPPIASAAPQSSFPAPNNATGGILADPQSPPVIAGDPNAERYESMGSLGTISDQETTTAATDGGTTTTTDVTPTTVATAATTPESEYDQAYQLLQQADYVGAEGALQRFIESHPQHALAGNAYYWLGETYYVRNDYQAAAVAFARGYKGFPQGSKAADNLLKLGMAFAAMQKTEEACATFARLERDQEKATALVRERLAAERVRAGCA